MNYLILIVSLVIFFLNPICLEGLSTLVYALPAVCFFVFKHSQEIGARSTNQESALVAKINKWLQSIIQILGMIVVISTMGNFNIPFISEIVAILQYISDNFDVSSEAVGVLIGVVMTVYGMIKENFSISDKIAAKVLKTTPYQKYNGRD